MLLQHIHSLGVPGFLAIIQDANTCISYSQFGEDTLILEQLSDFGASKYYVDIGAYHPSRFSNTRLLNMMGWRGINVDPNPQAMELFRQQRPNDINLNLGVAAQGGAADLYCFQEGAVNTFDLETATALINKGWAFLGKQQIPMMPINEILEKNLPQEVLAQGIGFLDIDCEGLDAEIVLSFDIAKYRPEIIAVESAGFDPMKPGDNKIVERLVAAGYRLFAHVGPTLLWRKNA